MHFQIFENAVRLCSCLFRWKGYEKKKNSSRPGRLVPDVRILLLRKSWIQIKIQISGYSSDGHHLNWIWIENPFRSWSKKKLWFSDQLLTGSLLFRCFIWFNPMNGILVFHPIWSFRYQISEWSDSKILSIWHWYERIRNSISYSYESVTSEYLTNYESDHSYLFRMIDQKSIFLYDF